MKLLLSEKFRIWNSAVNSCLVILGAILKIMHFRAGMPILIFSLLWMNFYLSWYIDKKIDKKKNEIKN